MAGQWRPGHAHRLRGLALCGIPLETRDGFDLSRGVLILYFNGIPAGSASSAIWMISASPAAGGPARAALTVGNRTALPCGALRGRAPGVGRVRQGPALRARWSARGGCEAFRRPALLKPGRHRIAFGGDRAAGDFRVKVMTARSADDGGVPRPVSRQPGLGTRRACTRARGAEAPRCLQAKPLRGSPSQAAPVRVGRACRLAQPARASLASSAML